MNKKEAFKRLIAEEAQEPLPQVVPRIGLDMPKNTRKIVSIIGPRRCGKTYHLFGMMQDLLEAGVKRQAILYANFEDDRLLPFDGTEIEALMEAFHELYPEQRELRLFLDEVQNLPAWEVAVRRVSDQERARIVLTGSSSKLISTEIATSLRGRTLTYEMQPFSFQEALLAKGVLDPKSDNLQEALSGRQRFRLKRELEEYMEYGGFPEVVLEKDKSTRIRILQEYLRVMVFRDIVERYAIRNTGLLDSLVRYLISNISRYFSVARFQKATKELQNPAKRTILAFLDHIEDVRLSFLVKRYGSIKEQMVSPRKIYSIDVGFRTASGFYTASENGRIAENLVFLKLREASLRQPLVSIYYWSGGGSEADFVLKRGKDVFEVIQVSWDLEPSKEREVRGLVAAARAFGLEEGTIVTSDAEDSETVDGVRITYIPLWKWLLLYEMNEGK